MKRQNSETKTIVFDIDDDEFGPDRYSAKVLAKYVVEPQNDVKYVDDVYVYSLTKNNVDIPFREQDELGDEIIDEIVKQLEYEL